MTEIYGNTARNLIWLGAPASDEEADANVRSLMEVWAHLQKRTDNCDRFFDTVMQARGHAPKEGRLPDGADLIALQRFYDCPWFTRLWVVQEAALPPRSQCHYGEHAIDLTTVTRVAVWLRPEFQAAKLARVSTNCDTCLRNAARIWSYSDETQNSDPKDSRSTALGDLLTHLNGFEAFDPRDHVYAMIGLYQRFNGHGSPASLLLKPDYSKPLSDVLRDTTFYVLRETRTLDCLRDLQLQPDSVQTADVVPSWIPRWHSTWWSDDHPQPLAHRFRSCGTHEQCSIRELVQAGGNSDPNILCVEGTSMDIVSTVWADPPEYSPREERVRLCRQVQSALRSLEYNEAQAERLLATTLVAGEDATWNPIKTRAAVKGFREWSLSEDESTRSGARQHHMQEGYADALRRAWRSRSVFLTECGRLGLGPKMLAAGDVVTILWGCVWPVVLRPLPHSPLYLVVGMAYVHGIMNGSAIKGFDATAANPEVFQLR
ncbi:hypothetical protein LTR53_002689 [Teratosphaeriaceae sp. CCFEE 6253]|nr:hypothetical protein LTR53_002689 [Teratosphaeriaceae sp. CCFEE 6253]